MKKTVFIQLLLLLTSSLISNSSLISFAACYGSDSNYTCNDESGNTYNINKFGNMTYVNGANYRTGNTWNENSSTYGNTTYVNGTDSKGGSWNENITHIGGTTTYSGTDSNGNTFYKSCTHYGCW